jgi:predicted enzyme related to lactoylglutathione lyase
MGHVILEIGDMETALRLYRDALGLAVQGSVNATWTVVAAAGGSLTLFRKKTPVPCVRKDGGSPFDFHVANFEEAAAAIERAGYEVLRRDAHGGSVRDPWDNVIGLHDHREE